MGGKGEQKQVKPTRPVDRDSATANAASPTGAGARAAMELGTLPLHTATGVPLGSTSPVVAAEVVRLCKPVAAAAALVVGVGVGVDAMALAQAEVGVALDSSSLDKEGRKTGLGKASGGGGGGAPPPPSRW